MAHAMLLAITMALLSWCPALAQWDPVCAGATTGTGNMVVDGQSYNLTNVTTGNCAAYEYTVVAGGTTNSVIGFASAIVGGFHNNINNPYAFIGGGSQNTASGDYVAVPGGSWNSAGGFYAVIGGGQSNTASTLATHATIAGGYAIAVTSRFYCFDDPHLEPILRACYVKGLKTRYSGSSRLLVEAREIWPKATPQQFPEGGSAVHSVSHTAAVCVCGMLRMGTPVSACCFCVVSDSSSSSFCHALCNRSSNMATAQQSFVGGGTANAASAFASTACGGWVDR